MKQNINHNASSMKKFIGENLAENSQEKRFPPDNMTQQDEERQQEQTRYLNRMLEAYGDCV